MTATDQLESSENVQALQTFFSAILTIGCVLCKIQLKKLDHCMNCLKKIFELDWTNACETAF